MEKRVIRRIPVNTEIRFYLWNPLFWKNLYGGVMKNISEKGMYICTETVYFPRDSLVEVFIPSGENIIDIPVKSTNIVWRNALSDSSCDGIGIELTDPPKEYIEYVKRLKQGSKCPCNG